jgi:hypothetical protein
MLCLTGARGEARGDLDGWSALADDFRTLLLSEPSRQGWFEAIGGNDKLHGTRLPSIPCFIGLGYRVSQGGV